MNKGFSDFSDSDLLKAFKKVKHIDYVSQA